MKVEMERNAGKRGPQSIDHGVRQEKPQARATTHLKLISECGFWVFISFIIREIFNFECIHTYMCVFVSVCV